MKTMPSTALNPRAGFGHGDGHASSSAPCFPCDDVSAAAASTLLAMQLDRNTQQQQQQEVPQQQQCVSENSYEGTSKNQQQPLAPTTNVGELVAKAKKAAVSLWMILHSQNCRLPKGTCPHRGCDETKLLLVHVKTCSAVGPNSPCPTQCKGCNETRKLLAHYRRCKDMRMKQVGLGRRSGMQPDQSCLVCSLMARYAKSMMDRSNNRTSSSSQGMMMNNVATLLSSSAEGKFNVDSNFTTDQTRLSPTQYPKRTPSMTLMPPPPPRSRAVSTSSPPIEMNTSNESFGSPPMHCSKIATVTAAITDPRSSASDPSLLGKSVDSVRVPFPILKHPSSRGGEASSISEQEELVIPGRPTTATTNSADTTTTFRQRQRAESYDERKSRSVKFAPNIIASRQYYFEEQPPIEPMPEEQEGGDNSIAVTTTTATTGILRPRSASCSLMNSRCHDSNTSLSSAAAVGCETIAEEQGLDNEDTVFDMDD